MRLQSIEQEDEPASRQSRAQVTSGLDNFRLNKTVYFVMQKNDLYY